MGETGCGKTRLIRYMCQLQAALTMDPSHIDAAPPCQTFFIMKVCEYYSITVTVAVIYLSLYCYYYYAPMQVHGGITEEDIVNFVGTVQKDARVNQQYGFHTVVFFDEANTTDAIGLIKEIMCDKRIRGRPITEDIKFIAACNPYRK